MEKRNTIDHNYSTDPRHQKLIDSLIQKKIIKHPRVIRAMRSIDRGNFFKTSYMAYIDAPQSISFGATISAPHMHAYALNMLKDVLVPGNKVLDVGSGSGILTLMFYQMMEEKGQCFGIDHIPQLISQSIINVSKTHNSAIHNKFIQFKCADGRKGWKEKAPFNVIHVGAAAPQIPQELIQQLANGGKLLIPVGPEGEIQKIHLIQKTQDGSIHDKPLMKVTYVPLTSKKKQTWL